MEPFWMLFYFILGTIVGSFLNVVALRYNSGRGLTGRSSCFSCGSVLSWNELIPILSYVINSGRCRNCGSRISLQYPFIEIFTGILFLGAYLLGLPLYYLLYTLIIFSILIVILIYDFRHHIIPDGLVYSFIAFVFAGLFIDFSLSALAIPTVLDIVAGPILSFPIAALWFISHGRWIGLGDAKLALGIGWMLGLSGGFSAIVLSFWIGAFVSVSILFVNRVIFFISRRKWWSISLFSGSRQLTMKSEVPFAPYLIGGLLLVFFFNINVLELFVIG
ncbi:prepilin peptidase [Patescibacteria group bacterium]|nr:prepilin peptidase [Patescibacteria group bacterium]